MLFNLKDYDPKYDTIRAFFRCLKCNREVETIYEQVEAKGLDEI
jgi:hypothetical protein